ncbi:hypothetical protein [Legionella saoudiensis]|uniref:hypothetical protein n=1 Tax=Legionella saoudiensis TaxID=1750561 RepID=UPI00122EA10E|nr:hypothetical protein [Legionella saoudiensis]
MIKKLVLLLILSFTHAPEAFSLYSKERIDQNFKWQIQETTSILKRRGCFQTLEPFIKKIEQNHQLFLDNHPLEATFKNLILFPKLYSNHKPIGCSMEKLGNINFGADYTGYYLESIGQYPVTSHPPHPTDFEKDKFIKTAIYAHNKIFDMCNRVTCDGYAKTSIWRLYRIYELIQEPNPDFELMLSLATLVKYDISRAFYFKKVTDTRYYNALGDAFNNMSFLFYLPKRYLFDLRESYDFREEYASKYTNYLANYTDKKDLNFANFSYFLEPYTYASTNRSMEYLISAVHRIHCANFFVFSSNMKDSVAEKFMHELVEGYTSKAIELFKEYCITEGEQCVME